MIISLLLTSKYYNLHLTKLELKDMWRLRNQREPNIKTIFNSFSGLKDITISTVEAEERVIKEIKREEVCLLILALLKKMLCQKVIMDQGKLSQKMRKFKISKRKQKINTRMQSQQWALTKQKLKNKVIQIQAQVVPQRNLETKIQVK